VHEAVEVVGGQHEAVALRHDAPAAEEEVAGEAGLQRARQVLVEDGVEVVVVGARVPVLKSRGKMMEL
jgi:hypothetical protein